jgi:hypothetical protein
LNRKVPGAGVVLTAVVITFVGFSLRISPHAGCSRLWKICSSTRLREARVQLMKDIVGAFVGEKKKFNRPVLVALTKGSDVATIGFVTRSGLAELGWLTTSRSTSRRRTTSAGTSSSFRRLRRPLDADPAKVMTFIVRAV